MKTILLFVLSTLSALATDVTIAWDASPVAVTNYTIRWSLAGNGTVFIRQTGTNLTTTLTGLAAGRWSVTATATSAQGIVSDPSAPLLLDVPAPPLLRLNLQGASTVDGPWTNLVTVGWSGSRTSLVSFYRGKVEWESQ